MKIFFIRHGETTGDIEDRFGGAYDDHLTKKGKEQSAKLGKQLKNKGIEAISISSLIRAQETANIIAQLIDCPVIVVEDLKERNQYGILSGMVKSEAKEKYPEMMELLKDKLNTIEGAESYFDFSKRISAAFNQIINEGKYNTLAMVSHGGPLRVLFRDILKWGEIDAIKDCAFVELEKDGESYSYIDAGGFTPSFQISVFNK